jgi:hypothetical protein
LIFIGHKIGKAFETAKKYLGARQWYYYEATVAMAPCLPTGRRSALGSYQQGSLADCCPP